MVFFYETENGIVLSHRPYSRIKKFGWVLVNTVSSMEAAETVAKRRFPNYTIDKIKYAPRMRKQHKKDPARIERAFTRFQVQYTRPYVKTELFRRVRRKFTSFESLKKTLGQLRLWENQTDMYWAIRPDGKECRVHLPEGKHMLPVGWRFGRYRFKLHSSDRERSQRGKVFRTKEQRERDKKLREEFEEQQRLALKEKTPD